MPHAFSVYVTVIANVLMDAKRTTQHHILRDGARGIESSRKNRHSLRDVGHWALTYVMQTVATADKTKRITKDLRTQNPRPKGYLEIRYRNLGEKLMNEAQKGVLVGHIVGGALSHHTISEA